MKKFILFFFALLASVCAFAQGTADFNTLKVSTSYAEEIKTANGWVINYSAVQGGVEDPTTEANPQFALLGSSTDAVAVCLNGHTAKVGRITSPKLEGGIGNLSFNYGRFFNDDIDFSLKVEVVQNEEVVFTEDITIPRHTKCTYKEGGQGGEITLPIKVAGDFVLVITNNCPSQKASNGDRISLWNLSWTAQAPLPVNPVVATITAVFPNGNKHAVYSNGTKLTAGAEVPADAIAQFDVVSRTENTIVLKAGDQYIHWTSGDDKNKSSDLDGLNEEFDETLNTLSLAPATLQGCSTSATWGKTEEDVQGLYRLQGMGTNGRLFDFTLRENDDAWIAGDPGNIFFDTNWDGNGCRTSFFEIVVEEVNAEVDFEKVNVAAIKQADFVEEGKWYLLKQKRGGVSPVYDAGVGETMKRAAKDDVVVAGTDALDAVDYLLRFIPTENEGAYNLQFANGHYWANTMTTTEEEPGEYNVYNINGEATHIGINKFDMANIVDNNGAGNTLAFWANGEVKELNGNNDWTVWEVEFVEKSQAAADLKALVDEYETAFNANNVVVEVGEGIITSTDQFSSPYSAGGEEPKSSLDNLLDMDGSTYWHSSWASEVDNHVHYLQVEFAEPISGDFELNMNRRVNGTTLCANDNPVKMSVETSLDGEEFVLVDEFDTPFTQTAAAPLVQATVSIPTPAKYLRFFNDKSNAADRGYWHCGDLQLKPIVVPAPNAAHAEAAAAFAEALAAAKACGANATDADVAALQAAYAAYVAALEATPAPATVDVVYTVKFNDEVVKTATVTETIGAAPSFDVAAPAYVVVEGMPETIAANTKAVELTTTLDETVPFEVGKNYVVFFRNGANRYYWNDSNEGVGNEVRWGGQNAELNSREELESYTETAKWTMGGNWVTGFTFTNATTGNTLTAPVPMTKGGVCNLNTEAATGFDIVKQSNGHFRFYAHGDNSNYLAHTSHGSHRVTFWNDPAYGVSSAEEGGASVVQFEEIKEAAPTAVTFEFTDNEDGTITITPSDLKAPYFFNIYSDRLNTEYQQGTDAEAIAGDVAQNLTAPEYEVHTGVSVVDPAEWLNYWFGGYVQYTPGDYRLGVVALNWDGTYTMAGEPVFHAFTKAADEPVVEEKYALNFDKALEQKADDRHVTGFKLNDQEVTFPAYTTVYLDATDQVIEVNAGEELQPAIIWDGAWMHGIVYVDLDNDGSFYEEGDLVAHSPYTGNQNLATSISAFTAPAKAGEYRMRVKTDWVGDSQTMDGGGLDPAGRIGDDGTMTGNNSIWANRGRIIDVTLKVVADEPETFPMEGVAYKFKNVDSQLYVKVIDDAEQCVTLGQTPDEMFFTAVEGGWTISTSKGYQLGSTAKGWNIGNTATPIVWTIEEVEGGYAFKNEKGYLGYDTAAAGQKAFRDKNYTTHHGVFNIWKYDEEEIIVVPDKTLEETWENIHTLLAEAEAIKELNEVTVTYDSDGYFEDFISPIVGKVGYKKHDDVWAVCDGADYVNSFVSYFETAAEADAYLEDFGGLAALEEIIQNVIDDYNAAEVVLPEPGKTYVIRNYPYTYTDEYSYAYYYNGEKLALSESANATTAEYMWTVSEPVKYSYFDADLNIIEEYRYQFVNAADNTKYMSWRGAGTDSYAGVTTNAADANSKWYLTGKKVDGSAAPAYGTLALRTNADGNQYRTAVVDMRKSTDHLSKSNGDHFDATYSSWFIFEEVEIPVTEWDGADPEVEVADATTVKVTFTDAHSVEATNYGVLAAIYDEQGDVYGIVFDDLFGDTVEFGSDCATLHFKKISEINAELAASAKALSNKVLSAVDGVDVKGKVVICGKSFKIDGESVYTKVIVKDFDFNAGGIATGLDTIATDADAKIFDLQGRRALNTKNGLLIRDGKKVVR